MVCGGAEAAICPLGPLVFLLQELCVILLMIIEKDQGHGIDRSVLLWVERRCIGS